MKIKEIGFGMGGDKVFEVKGLQGISVFIGEDRQGFTTMIDVLQFVRLGMMTDISSALEIVFEDTEVRDPVEIKLGFDDGVDYRVVVSVTDYGVSVEHEVLKKDDVVQMEYRDGKGYVISDNHRRVVRDLLSPGWSALSSNGRVLLNKTVSKVFMDIIRWRLDVCTLCLDLEEDDSLVMINGPERWVYGPRIPKVARESIQKSASSQVLVFTDSPVFIDSFSPGSVFLAGKRGVGVLSDVPGIMDRYVSGERLSEMWLNGLFEATDKVLMDKETNNG